MRQDLAHVLSIAPGGSRQANKSRWAPHPAMLGGAINLELVQALDDSPRRLSGRPRVREPRGLGFRLSALKRVLRAQVGRPWDEVFHELTETLTGGIARETRWHMSWLVQINCRLGEGGSVWHTLDGWQWYPVRGMYVHPVSGLLCETPTEPNPPHPTTCKCSGCAVTNPLTGRVMNRRWAQENWRPVDGSRYAERSAGVWYIHTVAMHQPGDVYYAERPDVDRRYIARTKQASRREMKRLGVRNSPATA